MEVNPISLAESVRQQLQTLEQRRQALLGDFAALGIMSKIAEIKKPVYGPSEFAEWEPYMISGGGTAGDLVDVVCYRFRNEASIVGKAVIHYNDRRQLIVVGGDVTFSAFVTPEHAEEYSDAITDSIRRAFRDPLLLDRQSAEPLLS